MLGEAYATPANGAIRIKYTVWNHLLGFIPVHVIPKSTPTIKSGVAMSLQLHSLSEAFVYFQVMIPKLSGTIVLDIIQQEIQPVAGRFFERVEPSTARLFD